MITNKVYFIAALGGSVIGAVSVHALDYIWPPVSYTAVWPPSLEAGTCGEITMKHPWRLAGDAWTTAYGLGPTQHIASPAHPDSISWCNLDGRHVRAVVLFDVPELP